jgi:uncharacterized membrane protein YjgN (DUF898 family)
MSAIEVAGPPPPAALVPRIPAPPTSGEGTGRFLGSEGAFFGLLVRGGVLLMFTLGIYRFWLNTDVRRFLWGNTEVAGDGLEYTGTARELLLGFLMAIVLLVPINGLIFVGTLAPTLLPYSGTAGFVLLALLGQFAFYRARRYRLTRTIYRGVRFFQTGSGWNYSLRANLLGILILLTAGLAYPWAQASLERYKMRHTHFGNLSGRFEGSGTRLFFRGILLWIIVMGPFLAGLFKAMASINWIVLAGAFTAPGADIWKRIEAGNPELAYGLALLIGGTVWSVLAATVLYPLFRAIVMRWWLSGLRVGEVTATSRLRTGQIYRVYGRFLGFSILFGMAASVVFGLAGLFFYEVSKSIPSPDTVEIAGVVLMLIAYVATMLGYSTIYQATVSIRLWRLSFETTDLAGLQALEHVEARGAASGPLGEGLADALDVGGI